ncbi:MAG: hypothetical protein PHO92_05225, partial [Candidatus Peribacteraceae bacterium]|nr:hypothetical protein [Candidatus Peribacteraceae bacterium]
AARIVLLPHTASHRLSSWGRPPPRAGWDDPIGALEGRTGGEDRTPGIATIFNGFHGRASAAAGARSSCEIALAPVMEKQELISVTHP